MKKINYILKELKEHIPFTTAAAGISILVMSFLLIQQNMIEHTIPLFEIFHPAHILFSSTVSAAIFYNYKKNIPLAIISSVIISILVGSVSDVIFPYLGSLLFKIPISFHLPVLEKPILIFGVSIIGASIGVATRKTKYPHFFHVFISVLASLLYIFSYSTDFSLMRIFLIFIITTISVTITCCLSDIVFPLIIQKNRSER